AAARGHALLSPSRSAVRGRGALGGESARDARRPPRRAARAVERGAPAHRGAVRSEAQRRAPSYGREPRGDRGRGLARTARRADGSDGAAAAHAPDRRDTNALPTRARTLIPVGAVV